MELNNFEFTPEYYLEKLSSSNDVDPDILNSSRFLDNLVNTFDELMKNQTPNSFNRALFMHLIEYGNFKQDGLINVGDFMKTYFTVYELMKTNRKNYVSQCQQFSSEIQNLKNKLLKCQTTEIVFGNGLTSNSKVMFKIKSITYDNNFLINCKKATEENNANNKYLNIPKFEICIEKETFEIEPVTVSSSISDDRLASGEQYNITKSDTKLYKKNINKINTEIVVKLKLFDSFRNNWKSILLEKIKIKDILEKDNTRVYEVANLGIVEFNFIWINSKISFINKSISELENKLLDLQMNFEVVERTLKYLEKPFPNLFRENASKALLVQNDFNLADRGLITLQKNELDVSENIDNFVAKIIGHPIIIWEHILFLLNKAVFTLLIFCFYFRSDYITLILSSLILGLQLGTVPKSKCYYTTILTCLICSFIMDISWFAFYFSNWNSNSPFDINMGLRKLSIFVTGLILLAKLIMIFSTWRTSIVYKMKINTKPTSVSNGDMYLRYLETA